MMKRGQKRPRTARLEYKNLPYKKPRYMDKQVALAVARTLRSRMPELKYVDTSTSDTLAGHSVVTLLNGTAEGITPTTRIGTKIQMVSIHFQATLENALTDADHDMFRCWLVYDKQTNGVSPAYTDIFKTASDVNAIRNLDKRQRFKVLFDSKRISLPAQANTLTTPYYNGVPPVHSFIECYKKINLPVNYGADTAAITSISAGALFLVIVATSSDAGVTLATQTRIRYTDV